jgi:hypothetical protein
MDSHTPSTHGTPGQLRPHLPQLVGLVSTQAFEQQRPEEQSPSARQAFPVAQGGQLVSGLPPQSTPVSLPFLTPSVQVAGWHDMPVHTPV